MENSLKKNSLYNILYNVANILFPLITSIYVARIIFAEGIGKVAYGQNIASYFVTFASLGLPTYGVREIAKVRNNKAKTNELFTELFTINAFFTTIAAITYIILIFMIPRFRDNYFLFLCCGIEIIMGYFKIDWFFQGVEDYKFIAIRSIIVKIVSFFFVYFFVRTINDYVKYALISSLAITANYVFNIFHVKRFAKLDFGTLHFRRHFEPLLILAVSVFLSSAYSKIDITMLGSMSTESATGLYNNSHKIIEMIITVCTSVSAVFLPRLSYCYGHDRAGFETLIQKGIKVLSFITFPISVGLFILAPQMLQILYGITFVPAGITIRIFTSLIIIKSFGNLLCYQLVIATGNEKKRLPAYLAAAILNIIFNTVLIPRMAQNGAAIASVISEVVVNGVQLYAMSKIIRISFPRKELLQGIGTAAFMGICILFLSWIHMNLLLQVVICVGVGCFIYMSINFIIKNEVLMMGLNIVKKELVKKDENKRVD